MELPMKTNVKHLNPHYTHEGAISINKGHLAELRRSVMSCMLFENSYYEDGVSTSDRIASLVKKVSFEDAANIAIEARKKIGKTATKSK